MIRRVAAILYDGTILFAIMAASTGILMKFIDTESIKGLAYQGLLFLEIFFYFILFWKIRGQTPGMRVWKVKTINSEGKLLTTTQCLIRFFSAIISFALLGGGFLWALFSTNRSTLHDHLSKSRLIYSGSQPYESERPHSPHSPQKESSSPPE